MLYKTHAPAHNISLTGKFYDWSDTSYHNVKVSGATGDIKAMSWGAVCPDITFDGDRDHLNIDWDTSYLSDDSLGGGYPAYNYMYLPANASCSITISNDIGSVIVQDLRGPDIYLSTNKGMLCIYNCSFSRIEAAATSSINASFSSENASFKSESSDIILQMLDCKGIAKAQTDNGNIILKVPEGASFSIKAKTGAGKISSNVPLKLSVDKPNEIEGVTNTLPEVASTINLETKHGDISIVYY